MNIKIQGGGSGTYANTGSCTGVTTYLQHEDLERMKNHGCTVPRFAAYTGFRNGSSLWGRTGYLYRIVFRRGCPARAGCV